MSCSELQANDVSHYPFRLASRPAPTSDSDGQPRLPDLGVDSSQVGKYIFLDSEKEAIKLLEKSGRKVVLHFSHKEFKRCKIMDQHLEVRKRRSRPPQRVTPCSLLTPLCADIGRSPPLHPLPRRVSDKGSFPRAQDAGQGTPIRRVLRGRAGQGSNCWV